MAMKIYKLMIFVLAISCLDFYNCKSQMQVATEQKQDYLTQVQVDTDLIKTINGFVADAKCAGVLDDKLAKALVTYSLLHNLSVAETQKLVMAAELASLSNQTRSLDLDVSATASNKSSAGEVLKWVCACSVMIVIVCALIIFIRKQVRENQRDELKRDIHDAAHRVYSAGEDVFIKADQAIKSWIRNLRNQK